MTWFVIAIISIFAFGIFGLHVAKMTEDAFRDASAGMSRQTSTGMARQYTEAARQELYRNVDDDVGPQERKSRTEGRRRMQQEGLRSIKPTTLPRGWYLESAFQSLKIVRLRGTEVPVASDESGTVVWPLDPTAGNQGGSLWKYLEDSRGISEEKLSNEREV